MLQVLFRIPLKTSLTPDGIPIYGFGMMLFLAFLLCTWLASRRADREGVSRDLIQDMAIWIFLGGLLGARITYLIGEQPLTSVSDFFYQLPRIWDGGIVLYGAVLGGIAAFTVAYWFIFRKKGHTPLQLIDIIAPAVAMGICLGRLGCFLNGCCYGQIACDDCIVYPVHFPMSAPPRYALTDAGYQTAAGFTYAAHQGDDEGARVGRVEPDSAAAKAGLKAGDLITGADQRPMKRAEDLSNYLGSYGQWPRGKNDLTLETGGQTMTFQPRTLGLHPTQLYESVSMFLLFLVLTAYYPLRTRRGQVTAVLMMGYAVHRYLNEMLRGDPRPEGFERFSSFALFAGGLLLAVYLKGKPAEFKLVEPVAGGEKISPPPMAGG